MRYVIFNWVHPDDAAAWEAMSAEERDEDVERHRAWFRKFGEKVVGGEELDEPRKVKTLRPGRQGDGLVVTDGPYVETKEILGGFVIVEAADMDEAVAMARALAVAGRPAERYGPGPSRVRPLALSTLARVMRCGGHGTPDRPQLPGGGRPPGAQAVRRPARPGPYRPSALGSPLRARAEPRARERERAGCHEQRRQDR